MQRNEQAKNRPPGLRPSASRNGKKAGNYYCVEDDAHPISICRQYRRQRNRQQKALHTDDSRAKNIPEVSRD